MNWDRVEGQWKQRRGKAMHHWGRVMKDELAAIAGKYEDLVGRLQEKYGVARESAQRQRTELKKHAGELRKCNNAIARLQKSLHNKRQSGGTAAGTRRPSRKRTYSTRGR